MVSITRASGWLSHLAVSLFGMSRPTTSLSLAYLFNATLFLFLVLSRTGTLLLTLIPGRFSSGIPMGLGARFLSSAPVSGFQCTPPFTEIT